MGHPPSGPQSPRPENPKPPSPPSPRTIDSLLTVDQAAHVLGVNPMSVYRAIWSGALPWVNVGTGKQRPRIRIRQSALERYINQRDMAGAA